MSTVQGAYYNEASTALECILQERVAATALLAAERLHSVEGDELQRILTQWNDRHPDILSRLPAELHILCLHHMEPRDRVIASQVSRCWHAIAINTPTLWFSTADWEDISPQFIGVLLQRSAPIPFHLSLDSLDDSALQYVIPQIRRIASIEAFSNFNISSVLASHRAPQLQNVYLPEMDFCPEYSPVQDTTPALWNMVVRNVRIPLTFRTLPSVIRLEFDIEIDVDVDLSRLFEVFPNLTCLTIRNAHDRCILPPDLPPSLNTLEMANDFTEFCDAHLLAWCGSHQLEHVYLSMVHNVLTALMFFISLIPRHSTWSMVIRNVVSEDMEKGPLFIHFLTNDVGVALLEPLVSSYDNAIQSMVLDRLSYLEVPAHWLVALGALEEIPQLLEVVVVFQDDEDRNILAVPESERPPRFHAPLLHSIHIFARDHTLLKGVLNPRRVARLASYHSTFLKTINIITEAAMLPLIRNWKSFLQFTERAEFTDVETRARQFEINYEEDG